jgi:hypothetical protein
MTKAITHYGESAVQMALDLVERPCMSKDVGAPGSLARRANDLGRRLVIAEDDPQARTTKQDEAEHKAAMLDLTRSRFRAETFEALIARLRGEVETTGPNAVTRWTRTEVVALLDALDAAWAERDLALRAALRLQNERDRAEAKLKEGST